MDSGVLETTERPQIAAAEPAESAPLEFREANGTWQLAPEWATFLIRFGYLWAQSAQTARRRIALISLPCDSAAAGLVTLGALKCRLEIPGANDRSAHFERIRSLAGSVGQTIDLYDQRLRGRKRGPYRLTGHFSSEMPWAKLVNGPDEDKVTISAETARFWQFALEPPVEILQGNRIPFGTFYAALPTPRSGLTITQNLAYSDSAICLAGCPAGDASTRRVMSELSFRLLTGEIACLADLLTIHGWQRQNVSRVAFLNVRNGTLDRSCSKPQIVIAYGEISFLDATNRFPFSDVVGVIDLSADRERLEAVSAAIASMAQWFSGDEHLAASMPVPPKGIAVALMKTQE